MTALHRAAFLAKRYAHTDGPPQILFTTFTRNLADALEQQLDLLVPDRQVRSRIDVVNVDRLAYQIVARKHRRQPNIVDNGKLSRLWQAAASDQFSATFLQREWEQVILAHQIPDSQTYLHCDRPGRGKPLKKGSALRAAIWTAIQRVLNELSKSRELTHLQVAQQAADIVAEQGEPSYRHVIVDEAQDLHPARWRLLRAIVAPGPDDLFIVADPNQRIYNNRVSLESLSIPVRGRRHKLKISYRTTQEILSWSERLLGDTPATGLDDQPDNLAGYRSETHGRRPIVRRFPDRDAELAGLVDRVHEWLTAGVEPSAIGVAARTGHLAAAARRALQNAGIPQTTALAESDNGIRVDTMHKMKGLEFRCVAVVGVDDTLVPLPAALADETEDPVAHAQDVRQERSFLFVACTRARDELYLSHTGDGSSFLQQVALLTGD